MKKTFYFSHDFNSRQDSKIKELIYKHGYLGYGIFWALVEDLYNNANALRADYKRIAFELRAEEICIISVVNDFGLFEVNNEIISSPSVGQRIDLMQSKSEKAKESAKYRWGENAKKNDANALQSQSDGNAIKENKIKDIHIIQSLSNSKFDEASISPKKSEKINLEDELVFDKFRKAYPGTKRGLTTEFSNFVKKHKDWKSVLPILQERLNSQFEARMKMVASKIFVPEWKNLQTYINGRAWEEELNHEAKIGQKQENKIGDGSVVVKRATGEVRFGAKA